MPTLKLKIPPLVQAGLCLIAMGLLDRYLELLPLPIPFRPVIAAVLIVLGGAVGVTGIVSFRREKTTVDPRSPEKAAALVVSGVYRYSRNPMYLALLLILLGLALLFGSLAAFLPIPFFILSINRLQIEPEEEALEAVFGEGYRQYRKKVGRWFSGAAQGAKGACARPGQQRLIKGKPLGHLLLPALPVLTFIILAAMPVEVVGCRLRGLLAAGIALAGALGGVVATGKGLFERIRNRPGSGWWIATGVVLALSAIYLVFLAI